MATREAVHRALNLYLRDATFFRDAWDQKVRELRRVAESTPWLLKFPIVNDGSTESLRNDILIMQCLMRYWFAAVTTQVDGYRAWARKYKVDSKIDELISSSLVDDLQLYHNVAFHFDFFVRSNEANLRLVTSPNYPNVERVHEIHGAFEEYTKHFMS